MPPLVAEAQQRVRIETDYTEDRKGLKGILADWTAAQYLRARARRRARFPNFGTWAKQLQVTPLQRAAFEEDSPVLLLMLIL